jgi:arylsulfatase A
MPAYGRLVCSLLLTLSVQIEPVFAKLPPANERPNIVLILADDLGYADPGCYGSKDIRTPNIDRLAHDGVRLTDAYAAAAVCSPTRASIMTGRYPQRSGFEWVIDYGEKGPGLSVQDSCLARKLKDAGYATALFGKWHLGYRQQFAPNAHGFDEFFGFLAADLDYYSHREATGEPGLYENTRLVDSPGYLTDQLTQRADAFIRKQQAKPFFLSLCYNAPHYPFQRPNQQGDIRTKLNYGPTTGTRADYVQMVERMDDGVGRVMKTLEELNLTKNTLVCFTNDNGGERLSDNGPLFHGKFSLWEGGIRVPCIMSWPGHLPAGVESKQPIISMDLTATFLAAAGVQFADAKLDGQDILPLLAWNKPPLERSLFWRMRLPGEPLGQHAIRRGKWKYIVDRRSELLFDLDQDIGERKNLAFQHPDIAADMRSALIEWEKSLPAPKN